MTKHIKIALDRGFIITASKEKLGIKNPLFNLGFLTPRESPNIQFDIIFNSLRASSISISPNDLFIFPNRSLPITGLFRYFTHLIKFDRIPFSLRVCVGIEASSHLFVNLFSEMVRLLK